MSDIKKLTIGSDELYAYKVEQVSLLPSTPEKNTLYILGEKETTASNSLDLDLSNNAEVSNFNIYGESAQESGATPSTPKLINSISGGQIVNFTEKNLYKTPESIKGNGITYVLNNDGSYNIEGTASGEANCLIFSDLTPFENGETYTFSVNQELPVGFHILLEGYNGTTWVRHALGTYLTNSRTVYTSTLNISGCNRLRYVLRVISGNTVNISGLKIQLEKGSSATPYEKYQENVFHLDFNEELFNPNDYMKAAVYVGSNGYQLATVSGQSFYIECKPNTTYVIKKSSISTTNQNRFGIYTTAKAPAANVVVLNTAGKNSGDDSSLEYTITTPKNAVYLGVFCVLTGTTDSEAEVAATLSIKEQEVVELRGVENNQGEFEFQDYIYRKGKDWFIRRYTDTFTLTGNTSKENWYFSGQSIKCNSIVQTESSKTLGAREFNSKYAYNNPGSTIKAYSEKLEFVYSAGSIYSGVSGYKFGLGKRDTGGGNSSIYISNPESLTIAQWTEFLATNPIIVLYATNEQYDEKITKKSLVDELDKIANLTLSPDSDKFTNTSADSITGKISISYNDVSDDSTSKWVYHENEWKTFDISYRKDEIDNLLNEKVDEEDFDVVDRYYRSLVPVGKRVEASKNLNTVEFLEVGKYYNNLNTEVATMTNCPTKSAFMMEVFSPLSQTIDNETTATYVYRIRKIMDYKGNSYTQNVESGSTAGVFTYGSWVKDTSASDISNFNNKYGCNRTGSLVDNRWVKIAQLSHSSSSNDNLSYTFRLDYCTAGATGVRQSFKFGIGSRLSNTSVGSLKYQLLSKENLVYSTTDYDFANNVKVIYKYTSGSPHKIELQIWTKSDTGWTNIYLWPCQESYKADYSNSLANSTANDEWTYYKEYNTNKQAAYSQSGFTDVTFEDKSKRYWANVEISDSSSTTTTPTFAKATFSGSTYPHLAGDGTNLTLCPTTNYTANNGAIVLDKTHFRPSTTDSSHIALGMASALWTHLYMSGDIYHGTYKLILPNKEGTVALTSDLPTVNDATLIIQKNGTTVDTFTANASEDKTINITVPVTAADVSALPASTKYGSSFELSVNSSTFVVTASLKDQDGNVLGTTQTIDLPLESVVVSGSFDSTTKKIILTLQNGNTVEIPVGDLVAGLQTEITSSNKLSSDLVDDTNHTNKFVTSAEKTKLSGIETGAEVNQNAFSNVKVGSSTVAADSKTDTIELVAGTNISLTADTTNDKITINTTGAPGRNIFYLRQNLGDLTSGQFNIYKDRSGTQLATHSDIREALTSTESGEFILHVANSTDQVYTLADYGDDTSEFSVIDTWGSEVIVYSIIGVDEDDFEIEAVKTLQNKLTQGSQISISNGIISVAPNVISNSDWTALWQ